VGVRTHRYLCVIQAGSLEGITYTFEHAMTDIFGIQAWEIVTDINDISQLSCVHLVCFVAFACHTASLPARVSFVLLNFTCGLFSTLSSPSFTLKPICLT